jgi:hypothetical protein
MRMLQGWMGEQNLLRDTVNCGRTRHEMAA